MCNLSDLVENRGIEKTKKSAALEMLQDRVAPEKIALYLHESVETIKQWEKEALAAV